MKKLISSFAYAIKGLNYTFRSQLNFKIHCFGGLLAIILGFLVDLNSYEWLWIILSIAMVIILELVNTAIEILVDLVSPEYHPKAETIKDVAAASVLIGALMALIIGLFIFVPKLI
ncbi:diacylglycerol kinase family protein [Pedobacter cryotolerans]|uniref:Diacylglycerol kinase family protein n=1 Tax=Pedobacter cryotolerans TaxID=2571270 RepID=A0A4U1CB15_9SPHI|nr:diacylglycerol kinase family protein [Pedobacter cryotolerans]TKC01793.1 diacylglycerol kinase family protein [Pedobacter cryotolerans]